MANPYHHAVSSTRKWGGAVEDYLPIHQWFDRSKRSFADFRHRALYHHSEGIFDCEAHFGPTVTLSTCAKCGEPASEHSLTFGELAAIDAGESTKHEFVPKLIPVRWIGEQHVVEDLGFIPHAAQYLERIAAEPWMNRSRPLSRELGSVITEKGGSK
jgi:hypothetical protein